MNTRIALSALLLTPMISVYASEREHGAHVHGHATLNLAVSGKEMQIQFDTPAANLIGFEHAARSKEDRATLTNAVKQLKNPMALITPNAAADCKVEEVSIESALLEQEHHEDHEDHEDHDHGKHDDDHDHKDHGKHDDHHDEHEHHEDHAHKDEHKHDDHGHKKEHDHKKHGHDHDDHGHGEAHADFEIEIEYHCDAPDRISSVDMQGLFNAFPGIEELDVQWITDSSQSGAELSARSPRIQLR